WLALAVITLQTTALVLVLRYSRASTPGPPYLASTAVLLTELCKLVAIVVTIWLENGRSIGRLASVIGSEVLGKPRETLRLSVPSFLYTIQNNLQFVALTNLDAATFQVSYQLKILMTALMSSLMLKKRVRPHQWLALVVLVTGVCLVQAPRADPAASPERGSSLLGLSAVLAACVSSGYSGVYFERVVKYGPPQSLSIRNLQLSVFSLPFGAAAVLFNDGAAVAEHGLLHGYTRYTWLVIVLQAFGGLVVSLTMKYADNILKGFATSISILLSALVSWALLGDVQPSWSLACGAGLVVCATFAYGYSPRPAGLASQDPRELLQV
ncbi:UDP-N-acetylglucosamine transporter-like, partial [Pollicipes pollicipes]|uniref:UDP-N-acetylglucosamine transporter-like n=1 Tax=Pollicipes pollicipes TaxID=41117 RepID=UPI001884E517